MTTQTKVLLGIIGAAAAGAVIGMLCAPEKGSDLRRKIKSAANDWACQLQDMIRSGKHKAEDFMDEASNKYSKMKEDLI